MVHTMEVQRYAIVKPGAKGVFIYIVSRNAKAALKCARRMYTLPRGTVAEPLGKRYTVTTTIKLGDD